MSWFDTISRWKKQSPYTPENSDEILRKNTGGKVYKDINKKREKVIIVKPKKTLHQPRKISTEEKVFRIQDEIRKFWNSLKKRQIGILVLVLFLSFVVYGVGFVLRTEQAIKNIIASPEKYYSVEKIRDTVYTLWQDYQILGLVADNSPIALEPLTSYGKILRNTRLLAAQSENIKKMADDILGWKHVSETQSIFPLLDRLWNIGENGKESIETLAISVFRIAPPAQSIQIEYAHYLTYLDTFLKHKKIWYNLLGKTKPTRILILNQNNDELRAGWGFPGTVFILEFENGKIKNISFHDIYELDHSLTEYIIPPKGIDQFKSKLFPGRPVEFRIRDANYFPTFAESARNINTLASASKIGNIDLVIGINTTLLSEIMSITGPVRIKGIPMKLDEKNITLVLSMLVEAKEQINGIPKGIITVLWDTILDTLIEKNKTAEVTKILWKNLKNGEILVASPHEDTQQAIDEMNLFDTWKTTKRDFVYPLFTSISKNKSDRIITRKINIVQVNDCKREVTLTQKHGWNVAVESQIKKIAHDLSITQKLPLLLPIQWSGDNKQYIRFILPKGSTMEPKGKVQLATLNTTNDETILDGYITTPTSGSSSLKFFYTLPKNLCGTETQFVKQAGLKNITVHVEKNGKILSEKIF